MKVYTYSEARQRFDIPGIKTKATTEDILEAIKNSRERRAEHDAAEDAESLPRSFLFAARLRCAPCG